MIKLFKKNPTEERPLFINIQHQLNEYYMTQANTTYVMDDFHARLNNYSRNVYNVSFLDKGQEVELRYGIQNNSVRCNYSDFTNRDITIPFFMDEPPLEKMIGFFSQCDKEINAQIRGIWWPLIVLNKSNPNSLDNLYCPVTGQIYKFRIYNNSIHLSLCYLVVGMEHFFNDK